MSIALERQDCPRRIRPVKTAGAATETKCPRAAPKVMLWLDPEKLLSPVPPDATGLSHRLRFGLIAATRFDMDAYGYNRLELLGIGTLAAYIQEHLPAVEVIMRERIEDLIADKPDVIGIGSITENYGIAIAWAMKVKRELDIPVIVGGAHISLLPLSLKRCFDVAVLGEGELTTVDLLASLIVNRGIDYDRTRANSRSVLLSEWRAPFYRQTGVDTGFGRPPAPSAGAVAFLETAARCTRVHLAWLPVPVQFLFLDQTLSKISHTFGGLRRSGHRAAGSGWRD